MAVCVWCLAGAGVQAGLEEDEVMADILELLETKVRPMVQVHPCTIPRSAFLNAG